MVVGEFPTMTDVLVVGGGPGGYAAAIRTAGAGLQTVLVERNALGGTCLNVGCIPSKALLHAAELAASGSHAEGWGIDFEPRIDMARVRRRIDDVVEMLTRGIDHLLKRASVEVWNGSAEFLSSTRARVIGADGAASTIEFREAIVATGSRPVSLPSLPLDGERVVDSTGLLASTAVPATLVVVGGGYIGVELGTAFAKLGSTVTIVEQAPRLLPSLDPALGSVVTRELRGLGVNVATSAVVKGVDERTVTIESEGTERPIDGDTVLVAVGRRPNTDGIGLDHLGVIPAPDGFIETERSCRAGRNACAIGDITRGPGLAHKAIAEAEVASRTVAGDRAAFDPACIPMVVFSDPEVASIGWTETEASAQGMSVKAFRFPLTASGCAMVAGKTTGFAQLVIDLDTDLVVGAQLAGYSASELAYSVGLAIEMGANATDVAMTIAPHPSMTEALVEAAAMAAGSPLHKAGGGALGMTR